MVGACWLAGLTRYTRCVTCESGPAERLSPTSSANMQKRVMSDELQKVCLKCCSESRSCVLEECGDELALRATRTGRREPGAVLKIPLTRTEML